MLIFRYVPRHFFFLSQILLSLFKTGSLPLLTFCLNLYILSAIQSLLSLKLGLTLLTPTTQFPSTPQVAETILVRRWQKITEPSLIIDENVLEEVFSYSFVFSLLHIASFSLFHCLLPYLLFLHFFSVSGLFLSMWPHLFISLFFQYWLHVMTQNQQHETRFKVGTCGGV